MADPKRSEGARYERKSILRRVRTVISDLAKLGFSDNSTIVAKFKALEKWILERRKRYEAKEGGLGRK